MNININDIIVSVVGAIVVAGLAWFIWHKKYFMDAINKLKDYLVSDNRENKKDIINKLDHQYDGPNGIAAQHRDLSSEHKQLHNDIQKVSDKIKSCPPIKASSIPSFTYQGNYKKTSPEEFYGQLSDDQAPHIKADEKDLLFDRVLNPFNDQPLVEKPKAGEGPSGE